MATNKGEEEVENPLSPARLERLVELLGAYASGVLTTPLTAEDSAVGLTPAQYEAVAFIARHGGCSAKDLGEGLRISVPSATRLVDRLLRKGVVDRRESGEDRRLVYITITDCGKLALAEVRAARAALLERTLATLPCVERTALVDVLERFLRAALYDARIVENVCQHCGSEHNRECVVNAAHEALVGIPIEHT
jgi:DNA-binding MarR family transcriptional regulator